MTTDEAAAVHPVAALFPMMSDEELDDLAADIKANGLIHPIVRDADGVLIDGRNRLEACRRAGVKPTYTDLDGHEPVGFILSNNIARRHLSKGQIAMAVARARLVSRQTIRAAAAATGADRTRIGFASVVIEHAPELADDVLAGRVHLDPAYEEALKRKRAKDDWAEGTERWQTALTRLASEAPDLAELVRDGRLTPVGAIAEADERARKEQVRRERMTNYLATALSQVWTLFEGQEGDLTADWIPEANPLRGQPALAHLWTATGVRDCAAKLERLAHDIDCKGGAL
jgi:ParB/Sulfiredoxin domain